jgi:periplasmic protein TonB
MPASSIPVLILLAAAQATSAKPVAAPVPAETAPRLEATRGVVPSTGLRAEPSRPLQSLISIDDYPASALANRDEGRTSFRLTVGPDGRVTGCVILGSSGSTALDSATCEIVRRRGRFTPARDGSGRPVEDQYFGELAWRIMR